MADYSVPWRSAWQEALYGPGGFYRSRSGPAGHFSTSSHGDLGRVLAQGLAALCERLGATTVVDVGAGRGELLTSLAEIKPDLQLVGVDVHRPHDDVPRGVEWMLSPGGAALPNDLRGLTDTLVVANEWLDVVPCTISQMDADARLREVNTYANGREALGPALDEADMAWVRQWWPSALEHPFPGARVEVGSTRDAAWADLVSRVDRGIAIAMDYGHTMSDRPSQGTLTGYRRGQQVRPVANGSCDVTAHVAMDSLQHDALMTQGDALAELGITPKVPDHALASREPATYLQQLTDSSAVTLLTRRGGLGDFLWAVATKGPR